MRRTVVLISILAMGVASGCGDRQVAGSAPTGLQSCGSEDGVVAAFLGGTEGGGLLPSDRPGAPSGYDVWVISADGSYRRLTEGLNSRSPWLSADGRMLYSTRSDGLIHAGSPAPGSEGWRHDLRSGEETLLVRGVAVHGLSASPDGTLLAYSSSESATSFTPTIKIAEAEAPDEPIMIFDGDPPDGYLSAQTAPAFSPDGRLLAYLSVTANSGGLEQSSMVRLVDLATGEDSVLYTAPFEEILVELEWLPDQSRILATRDSLDAASIDPTTGRTEDINIARDFLEWSSAGGTAVSAIGVPPEDYDLEPGEADWLYMTWTIDGGRVDADVPEPLAYAQDLTIADCAYRGANAQLGRSGSSLLGRSSLPGHRVAATLISACQCPTRSP